MAQNLSAKNQQLTQAIAADKAARRGPIKFQLSLNPEQKVAKEVILSHALTILTGAAGSGKTLLACQVALDRLFRKEIKKIVITRPTVSREEIGFLPGGLEQKMDPWMQPIYANFYQLYNREKIDKAIEDEQIEIVPLAFMRGRTFLDAVVIVDEAQNCTHTQMSMIVSRLGLGSAMIICGDTSQVDLRHRRESGLGFLMNLDGRVDGLAHVALLTNHRHPIVEQLLAHYEARDLPADS